MLTGRKALLLGAALVVTGSELVLWRALHDATEGLQHMARIYADHRCSDVTVTAEILPAPLPPLPSSYDRYHYEPGKPLVQPPPMADQVIARSPITLGGPNRA